MAGAADRHGTLQADNPAAAATERRYRLPSGAAEVLADRDSPPYLAPMHSTDRVAFQARAATAD
ncbi:MAG: hypothetical protein JO352_28465 [Chloroflexi bacterium]|nr:hypothetical protein [Chloroflexota bacterium]